MHVHVLQRKRTAQHCPINALPRGSLHGAGWKRPHLLLAEPKVPSAAFKILHAGGCRQVPHVPGVFGSRWAVTPSFVPSITPSGTDSGLSRYLGTHVASGCEMHEMEHGSSQTARQRGLTRRCCVWGVGRSLVGRSQAGVPLPP